MLIKKLYDYYTQDIEDLNRIRKVLNEHGFDMLLSDIYTLWSKYSDKASANWLILPQEDNKLYDILIKEIIS